VKKDVPLNFLTDPQEGILTFRLTNVLIYEWLGGKHVCVDLIWSFLIRGTKRFTIGQTTLKVVSNKLVKHEKWCFDN
jgi:hypothetical protein